MSAKIKKVFKLIYARFYIAFTILTRLPLPASDHIEYNRKTAAESVIFFPLIGFFYGIAGCGLIFIFKYLNVPDKFTAISIMFLFYILNRFLHFDGFCDVCDAYLSDRLPDQRLLILKDSNLGTYALGCGAFLLLAKYLLVSELIISGKFISVLLILPIFSKTAMAVVSYKAEYPRMRGTASDIIGKISLSALLTTLTVFFILLVSFFFFLKNFNLLFFEISIFIIITVISAYIFRIISYKKINGLTGDSLGALHELIELILLITAIVIL